MGALSAISGLSPGPASLRSLRPRAALLSSMPVRLARQQLLVRCPGEDRGWSARRERECTQSPGAGHPGHRPGPDTRAQRLGIRGSSLHCIIMTLCHESSHDLTPRDFVFQTLRLHFAAAVRFDSRVQIACSG